MTCPVCSFLYHWRSFWAQIGRIQKLVSGYEPQPSEYLMWRFAKDLTQEDIRQFMEHRLLFRGRGWEDDAFKVDRITVRKPLNHIPVVTS